MSAERDRQIRALEDLQHTEGWHVLKVALRQKIDASQRRLSTSKVATPNEAFLLVQEEQAKQRVLRSLLTELTSYGLPEEK